MGTKRGQHKDIRLERIMHPAVSVSPEAPAHEALKVMQENKVPGVPVVEDGKLIGFVSDGHLLGSALPKYMNLMDDLSFVSESADEWVHYFTEAAEQPVREVMTSEVSRIELGKSALAVAHKMIHDGVSSVVIIKDDEMVGIVNRLDLYTAIVDLD